MKKLYHYPELIVTKLDAAEYLMNDIDASAGDIIIDGSEGMDTW